MPSILQSPPEPQTKSTVSLSDLAERYGGVEHERGHLKGATVAGQPAWLYMVDGKVFCGSTEGPYSCQAIGCLVSMEFGLPLHTSHERAAATHVVPAANDNSPIALNIFDWKSARFVGEPEPTEYLVNGVIESGIPALIASMGEVGKSFAMLELSRRVAFGSSALATPIFGGQVVQEGTAVFVAGEDDARAMHRRLASLDAKGARFAAKGDKLITVPMPSAVKAIKPFWRVVKGELVETPEWRAFADSLDKISDLRIVTIDPLQLFAAVPLNEDPASGQFVCGSIASLAAHTKANVFFAHHMGKRSKEIVTLADARDAIRGTTALVDGVRLAYALWYGDHAKAIKICRQLGVAYEPNRIVHGGVVKANGAAKRVLSTYARGDNGLLIDKTAGLGATIPEQGDLRAALVIAIEGAAAARAPFTKTGQSGLYEMRERLPEELQLLSKARLDALAEEALTRGEIVKATAKGEKIAKWLDVPTGMFAHGLGEFRVGTPRL
ncbi:AAA family ATPase [Mesorhizobium sp. BR-1-1-8]|uniref:AAA family ATPase n=1 Tax=Mesorhizobium sp. BR-1-1-8 TaxID=2876659 RepID=UPI001CCBABC4|nr:AAA family ATPase [Mesorhizobium sp. BR-1-1-8]MBZ9980415.1 AAA family ATPase [Mesorhizobium sp. BR-1-1-8]